MRGAKPPRAQSAKGTRVPNYDAILANRDRRENGAVPVSGRAKRPVSAQAARRDSGNIVGEKTMAIIQLQEKCMELKKTGNSLQEESTKNSTRLQALKRDLKRRDRLLQQMVKLSESGQCMDGDAIEKLREERNMLPIVHRRAQDLQLEVEKKDAAIRGLKHNAEFTRTIELQVEYATWQHEAKRLESLLNDPGSDLASQEVRMHAQRSNDLKSELGQVEDRLKQAQRDVEYLQASISDKDKKLQERKEELNRKHEEHEERKKSLMGILQKRSDLEQKQIEMERLKLELNHWKAGLKMSPEDGGSSAALQEDRGHSVQEKIIRGSLRIGATSSLSGLRQARQAIASRIGQESLFSEFLSRDKNRSGTLSKADFIGALDQFGISNQSSGLWDFCREMELTSDQGNARWLDFLVLMDRCASSMPLASHPSLPDTAPLRAGFLREIKAREEFEMELAGFATSAEAEIFFSVLTKNNCVLAKEWAVVWEAYGSDGLLLRLPLGEIAPRKEDLDAWFMRCSQAVNNRRKDLKDSCHVWPENSMLTREKFRTVCLDVLGGQLSSDDVEDLWLFINGGQGGTSDMTQLLDFSLSLRELAPKLA